MAATRRARSVGCATANELFLIVEDDPKNLKLVRGIRCRSSTSIGMVMALPGWEMTRDEQRAGREA